MITFKEYFIRSESETVKAIAESIGKPPKAINRALERAGYTYNRDLKKWEWAEEGAEPLNEELSFGQNNNVRNSNSVRKAKIVKENKTITPVNNYDSNSDIIGQIINKKISEQDSKSFRGFYLSDSVNNFIDNIEKGRRSEFVEECIKKVLKDRGIEI